MNKAFLSLTLLTGGILAFSNIVAAPESQCPPRGIHLFNETETQIHVINTATRAVARQIDSNKDDYASVEGGSAKICIGGTCKTCSANPPFCEIYVSASCTGSGCTGLVCSATSQSKTRLRWNPITPGFPL